MQIDSINSRTRTRIWNRVKEALPEQYIDNYYYERFAITLFDELGLKTENAEYYLTKYIEHSILQEMAWNEVYDLAELILDLLPDTKSEWLAGVLNNVLEKENCAYRILHGTEGDHSIYQVQRITNELELQEIEQATQTEYDAVNKQIMNAVSQYSDFEKPDYADAVRCAIAAVESAMRILDGKAKTLGDAIKRARKAGTSYNQRLLDGLEKLYAYASEAVRHGSNEPVEVTEPEAKLMIVTCSAIVNYLLSEYSRQE